MKKKLFRLLVMPLVFIFNTAAIFGGLIFPTTLIIGMSLILLLSEPFIWLLNLGLDEKIVPNDAFVTATKSNFINHFLGTTILVWFPFFACHLYFTKGEFALS